MAFDELLHPKGDKSARIEELLAKLGGKLQRASELTPRPRLSQNVTLEEILPDAGEVGGTSEGVRLRTSEIPICEGGEGGHPRGYVFRPHPQWHRHSPCVAAEVLRTLGCEGLANGPQVALERIAFLDTETTGLGGATGTYAFLVGLGFFRLEWGEGAVAPSRAHFVCEQYFMEDYPHEPAMLELLAARLREFDVLVTFNGAAYDLPLLQARATLNRMRLPLDLPHLDLLWSARRLWRRRLGSCSLASIERHVLGVRRIHDIPGAEIPYIYFDHLRGLGRERLVPVFDHNVQDIVSLGALLLRLCELAADPAHEAFVHAGEAFGMACLHSQAGSVARALDFLAVAAQLGPDPEWVRAFVREALRLYRREKDYAGGAALLERACAQVGRHAPDLFDELAKWYERYLRDPLRALDVIERAQVQARFELHVGAPSAARTLTWRRALDALEARRRRILAKANNRA